MKFFLNTILPNSGYNTVLKELSLHGSDNAIHSNYSILWLNIAKSQVTVVYNIPTDKLCFFCAGRTLRQSKITSFYIWNWDRLEAKRWWRYFVGQSSKLQRDVKFLHRNYLNLFSDVEKKFLRLLK